MKTRILILFMFYISHCSCCVFAGNVSKTVTILTKSGETAEVEIKKKLNIYPLIIDRMDRISIGAIENGYSPTLKLFYQSPKNRSATKKNFLAVCSNTTPKFLHDTIPAQCSSSVDINITVEATDADGDGLWYRWIATSGLLMLSSSETGNNRFHAPYLNKGDKKIVELIVQATDSYGQTETLRKQIEVVGTGSPTSYLKSFVINLKDSFFSRYDISSLVAHENKIHVTDAKNNYYILDPESRVIQRSENNSFGGIMSDGINIYGLKDMSSLFCLGKPASKAVLGFTALAARRSKSDITCRLMPPDTIYMLDVANKLVDSYRLTQQHMQCQTTHHIPVGGGSLVSGDWCYPRGWCSLVSDSNVLVTEFYNGTTRKLQTGIDRDANLAELAAGLSGQVAVRRRDGSDIYIGNVFSETPFDSIHKKLSNMKLRASSMHWAGLDLMIGTKPSGVAIYSPTTKLLKFMGTSRAHNVTHITFLKDGTLLAYDESLHSFIQYNIWGFETGILKLDKTMQVDDLDAGRNGQAVALDWKKNLISIFSLSDFGASATSHKYTDEKPQAICIGDESLSMLVGDSTGIGFSGDRMMVVSAYTDDADDKNVLQVSKWSSSRKSQPKHISIDQDQGLTVAANNLSKSVVTMMNSAQVDDQMRFFSYNSLGLERVSNIEVLNGLIYILDVKPTVEVVIMNASSGRIIHRWNLNVSRDSELAVAEGQLVVLDRKSQKIHWHKIK